MTKKLLRLFALLFWYLALTFVVQLYGYSQHNPAIESTIRGSRYAWDYEAMYAALNLVWGIYCWKASKQPEQHALFIEFTIAANIFHPIVMTTIGFFRSGEFYHLLIDSLVLLVPALLLLHARATEQKLKN